MNIVVQRIDKVQDSSLFKELQGEIPELATGLAKCWENVRQLLDYSAVGNPTYTPHGTTHALAVVSLLDALAQDTQIKLTGDEKYALLAAALLHDIGMVGGVSTAFCENRIRGDHNVRSYCYIREKGSDIGLERRLIPAISNIALSHRAVEIEKDIKDELTIRLRLLCSLVRLADECHITKDRVPADTSALALGTESRKHFSAHANTLACQFDAGAARIVFSVIVNNEEEDRFFTEQERKVQHELECLASVFELNGIAYKNIVFVKDRDKVLMRRMCRALLQRNRATPSELSTITGEAQPEVASFLRKFGRVSPFTESSDQEKTYAMDESEPTLWRLVDDFVVSPSAEDDPYLFMSSAYVQRVLKEDLLQEKIGKKLSRSADRKLIFRILRASPSALRYMCQIEWKIPPPGPSGGGGIYESLLGELQNDFLRYPDLLLEPGLLDDLFDDGRRMKEVWERWKVHQVAWYHKAIDREILVDQWMVPNEWERKAEPLLTHTTGSGNVELSMEMKKLKHDPIDLMIAAYRTGLPCSLESSEGMKISARTTPPSPINAKTETDLTITFKPGPKEPSVPAGYPARLTKRGKHLFLMSVIRSEAESSDAPLAPFWLKVRSIRPAGDKKPGLQTVSFGIDMHYDRLDCEQAATFFAMAEDPAAQISVEGLPGSDKPQRMKGPKNISSAPRDVRKVVRQMARIQKLTGESIPYPLVLPPDHVRKAILNARLLSRTDACAVWEHAKKEMKLNKKPIVSSVVVEVTDAKKISYREFLDIVPRLHYPRVQIDVGASDKDRMLREMDQTYGDPSRFMSVTETYISLSPAAALAYLSEHKIRIGNDECIQPLTLSEVRSKSYADAKTEVSFYWQAAIDRVWCDVTPFLVTFKPQTSSERWCREYNLWTGDGHNDLKRAYMAAREAHRLDPESGMSCVTRGWAAFLLERLDEAITVTEKCKEDSEKRFVFLSYANLGLYLLKRAKENPSSSKQDTERAKDYYEKALPLIPMCAPQEQQPLVRAALNDLRQWRADLVDSAADQISRLEALLADKLPLSTKECEEPKVEPKGNI